MKPCPDEPHELRAPCWGFLCIDTLLTAVPIAVAEWPPVSSMSVSAWENRTIARFGHASGVQVDFCIIGLREIVGTL